MICMRAAFHVHRKPVKSQDCDNCILQMCASAKHPWAKKVGMVSVVSKVAMSLWTIISAVKFLWSVLYILLIAACYFWQVPLCNFIMIYRLEVHSISQTLCITLTARTAAVSHSCFPIRRTVKKHESLAVLRETSHLGPCYIPGWNSVTVQPRLDPTH